MPFLQTSETTTEQTIAVKPTAEQRGTPPEPEVPEGSSWRKWLVVLVIVLAVGAAVWRIHSNTAEQAASANKMASMGDMPVPVQVVTVERKTMPIYLNALGTVTAYNTVTIKSRVDGQLMKVNVREGQAVRQGDLLIEIDPKPYEAAVAQAQGQLVKDEANAANADAEAKRYTALLAAGVVSKETQQLQLSTAGQAQGALDADRAAIQAAKVNLGYTKIASPINGVVGLRQVDAGNIVHASDTTGLLVVTQLHPIAVIFTLPEDQLPEVLDLERHGKRLKVEAYDRSGTTHLATGSLLTADNQIDPSTGTDKLKAIFDNKEGELFPNQFVNVRLVLQDRLNATVIPSAAVENGIQGSYVYVVKPGEPPAEPGVPKPAGEPRQRQARNGPGGSEEPRQEPYFAVVQTVVPDLTEGGQMILKSGVEPGDQIVIDGQEKLKNGSRVVPHASTRPNPAGSVPASAAATPPGMRQVPDVTTGPRKGLDEPRRTKGTQR